MAFRYFEFAEESTPGTMEATPEMSCDPMSLSAGLPDNPDMEYKGGIGRGKTVHRPGAYNTEPSYEGGTDIKMLARMLYFALGNIIIENTEGDGTPTGEPDTSEQWIYPTDSAIIPTFSGWFGIDLKEYQIPGIILNKLELESEKEYLKLKLGMVGLDETVETIKTKAELTPNPDYPLAFFEVDVYMQSYGGVEAWSDSHKISSDVKKLKFSIDNGAKADDGYGQGSRTPYKIPAGERVTGFEFDYDYLTQTWYDLMQGSADGPLSGDGSTEFRIMVRINAGIYGSIDIELPRCIVSKGPLEADGRDALKQPIAVDAYQDDVTLTDTGTTDIYAEIYAVVTLNFTDSTEAFDGPTWAEEPTP